MSFQDLEAGTRSPAPNRFTGGRQQRPSSRGDPSQEVAAGIFRISTAVNSFFRLVNSIGTPKDTLELRDKLQKTRLQISELVKNTSAKLKEASEADLHGSASQIKKIADAKLAKDFQSVLKEFQKAQRLAAEREITYTPVVTKEIPTSYNAPELDTESLRISQQQALLLQSRRQEVVFLDNEITFNEAIIEEREQGIREIEDQIRDVNGMFKDLALMVNHQGNIVDDISSNLDNSHAATTQATVQLRKAAKTQRSNSSLTCLLILIFGIVLLIVIIVVLV
ncbi:Syntaxin-21 [Arabidopsis thaliana]|jgi:syntaxin 7|uniref:Syntaxin-21 n=4 Tax=Arabidopsis TaxID=3701 RepID=SYP21_ARATH|nr:syntaxin of plants 21 [Arabidopsis thaliana]Q39233.1 RecName: Full=Syntaxin-21; Short=AtSYP21; AltName: Full=PEP12 homolog; Short=AtPEP12; AltName: Full=aPEP12 [Arabidopsis thaliana]KAG7602513.1 SNARE domain [Arabidopsis thaliana x Arabidopsis arenosa]AAA87296.1 syntaxin of plants 21 [Arabidopsis thaliana]AAL06486.1 AT5g16830/F5E19_170 [Arabidopsis thaliana]ABE02411.1 At5g16830 [Arabidopsis thaliana]AED92345.1 syntaxin of plants 21 [Arabidopsis thaliana]|eukprot:NP_197185.1 syntaxin of plants 21 [Arabidopsis thaliana]